MKYCTNCGNELNENVKFCTSCGNKIEISNKKVEKPLMYKRKSKSLKDKSLDIGKKALQKNVGKSIQDEATKYVKSKLEETPSSKVSIEKEATNIIS